MMVGALEVVVCQALNIESFSAFDEVAKESKHRCL
jgi:hypothetical protein